MAEPRSRYQFPVIEFLHRNGSNNRVGIAKLVRLYMILPCVVANHCNLTQGKMVGDIDFLHWFKSKVVQFVRSNSPGKPNSATFTSFIYTRRKVAITVVLSFTELESRARVVRVKLSSHADCGRRLERLIRQEHLTKTERKVLEYIAQGFSNQQVADTMHVSLETIKSHVKSILGKLGVSSRTQAALSFFNTMTNQA